MQWIRAGTLSGDVEDVVDGYVWQADRNGIQASWLAMDPQSNIINYQVAVGTTSGKQTLVYALKLVVLRFYCNFGHFFAGGKFCENVDKTFQVGVIFTMLLIFSSYRHMGFIFARGNFCEEDKSEKNAKLPPRKNFHVYSTWL